MRRWTPLAPDSRRVPDPQPTVEQMSSVSELSDARFLGLSTAEDPTLYRFAVRDHLARMDGRLYGGTAIAASITVAELVTARTPLWMTTQFVSTAPPGATITVRAEVLAEGGRASQLRVTGADELGQVMFASLGATGRPTDDLADGMFEQPPVVDAPEEAPPWEGPFRAMAEQAGMHADGPVFPTDVGFHTALEFRAPRIRSHPDAAPGRMCLWARRRDGGPATPAVIAYMADLVPLSVSEALGVVAIGTSLDNTIRIGRPIAPDWVLLDLRPHLSAGGFGHGAVHAWSADGHLLGTASQTAVLRRFDLSMLRLRPT